MCVEKVEVLRRTSVQQVRREAGLHVLRAAKDRTALQNGGSRRQRRPGAREHVRRAVRASELQGAFPRCVRLFRNGDIWLDSIAIPVGLRAPFSSHVSV